MTSSGQISNDDLQDAVERAKQVDATTRFVVHDIIIKLIGISFMTQ